MSRFKPVKLPPDRALGKKASMTLLKHFQACPRSGYLYALHKGTVQSMEMVRGSAVHLILERAVEAMLAQSEPVVPSDVVKGIADEVLAELPVPLREHDFIREQCFRWAAEWTIDPSAVIACETLVVLDLEGWQVRCKIDFAEARAGGLVAYVADWKSSRAAPGYEEIARKRPDGTLAAKNFQLVLYALALAYGHPVRVEPCGGCKGEGRLLPLPVGKGGLVDCPDCGGRGHVEIPEPFPLAAAAEQYELELVFPAIENSEGLMVRRPMSLNRLELAEYRESLIALLRRLEKAEQSGDWPAIVSDEACNECPARAECPIPRELRSNAGEVNTAEEAAEAAEWLARQGDELSALRAELKRWAKGHETEVRYGRDKALRFVYGESERIDDKQGMFDAVEAAVSYGVEFDRSAFVRTVGSTNFKAVTLTADELAEEAGERSANGG